MFVYDKKIAYLYYKKREETIKNAGHIKVTYRANSIHIEMYIRDMPKIINGLFDIKGLGEIVFEDMISIEGGQAVYKKTLPVDKDRKKEDLYGLQVKLGEEESLEAIWFTPKIYEAVENPVSMEEEKKQEKERTLEEEGKQEKQEKTAQDQKEKWEKETAQDEEEKQEKTAQGVEEKQEKAAQDKEGKWEKETAQEEKKQEKTVQGVEKKQEKAAQKEETEQGKKKEKKEAGEKGETSQRGKREFIPEFIKAAEKMTFSIPSENYEDKWKELCKRHEIVHPFGNEEEYISIEPKDFIIFPEKYQHLANNSFLLHGYYNYRHIILGKKKEVGKNIYFLGVPGVYYEREKMVAIMFGFEGFECGEKKPSNGGFGYYMRRVEI